MPKSKVSVKRAKKLLDRRRSRIAQKENENYGELIERLTTDARRIFLTDLPFEDLEQFVDEVEPKNWTPRELDCSRFEFLVTLLAEHLVDVNQEVTSPPQVRKDYGMRLRVLMSLAYSLTSKLLGMSKSLRDTSGWLGVKLADTLRERWAPSRVRAASLPPDMVNLPDRWVVAYFVVDFLLGYMNLMGLLIIEGTARVSSVLDLKSAFVAHFAGYLTSNGAYATRRPAMLDDIWAAFQAEPEEGAPEAPESFDIATISPWSLPTQDALFAEGAAYDAGIQRALEAHLGGPSDETESALQQAMLAFAAARGPRAAAALGEAREPTVDERREDYRVLDMAVSLMSYARGSFGGAWAEVSAQA